MAGRRRQRQPEAQPTEVDAYIFIKANLKDHGWDTRNPERVPAGQVWTQNECLSNLEIKRLLNLDKPENIVKVRETALWVIEAKRKHNQIDEAISDAIGYANKLNRSPHFKVPVISGVAGNDADSYIIRTRFLDGARYVPVTMNGVEVTGLLSPEQCQLLIDGGRPNLDNPPIDEKLFIARAEQINEILHLGAVNPHTRASVMAALLLSKLSDTGPNIDEPNPSILIGDINARVSSVLRSHGKPEFEQYIRIALPASADNHIKFRSALVQTIQQLDLLNIRSAMNSGADWLGVFYEVFLKYASWAQDLGIVLTPRHLTRWVADVMDTQLNDIIYDPTCGTGGFLVAAFDSVKQLADPAQLAKFKKFAVFGVEQDAGMAALAVVNMIFRGDGKNNIIEGDCFQKFLKRKTTNGNATAQYDAVEADEPPITKVMMNPPFALKRGSEKEFKFIEQALKSVRHGGVLFSVLPYSTMVRPGKYKSWRKNGLLPNNTLLAVVTFPGDVFYPVGVTTVGVFIRKGIPHPANAKVLWVRALTDGLLKSKGKRLPSPRTTNALADARNHLRAFLHNQNHPVPNVHQFTKVAPIAPNDAQVELAPEVYLDQAHPTHEQVVQEAEKSVRDLFAHLIRIDRAKLTADLIRPRLATRRRPAAWATFKVTDLFALKRGNFHSIANLDEGDYPTVSRVSTDNGLVGFFDKPAKAKVWPARTITVSTVTGDAFVQPVPFISTDNVVLCQLRPEYSHLSLPAIFFIQLMLNEVKWRYSYGRQCYKTKFAGTEVFLPVTAAGAVDEQYMREVVEGATHWPLVNAVFQDQLSSASAPSASAGPSSGTCT